MRHKGVKCILQYKAHGITLLQVWKYITHETNLLQTAQYDFPVVNVINIFT